jgi:hypothetical protein
MPIDPDFDEDPNVEIADNRDEDDRLGRDGHG